MGDVKLLLVTGSDEQLSAFHGQVCNTLNRTQRRGQTVCYTCSREHFEVALAVAAHVGVWLRERV